MEQDIVSIIIINYNTFQLTLNCIRSIKETTQSKHEIILIDNNSNDADPKLFLKFFPSIKLIQLNENLGYGRANNIGMKNAKGSYILLLNSDTIVQENAVDETLNFLRNNLDVDIIGCRSILESGITQKTAYEYHNESSFLHAVGFFFRYNSIIQVLLNQGVKYRRKRRGFLYDLKTLASSETDEIVNAKDRDYLQGRKIGFLMGVYLLFRKSVFEDTKGFDPDFFMYHEEKEWFLNRLKNYNTVYYPKASIMHFHGKSDVYNKMSLQHKVSDYLFWYKMGYLQFFLFIIYNIMEIPSKVLVGLLTSNRSQFREIVIILKSLPYTTNVIRYSNKFGSRKEMLKIDFLRKNNL